MTRGEIWLAALGPVSSEIRKAKPCVVVSPPEMHDYLRTVVVAPMVTGKKPAPYRIPITFEGKRSLILLDQIRTLDKTRLVKRLGKAAPRVATSTLSVLRDVFAE